MSPRIKKIMPFSIALFLTLWLGGFYGFAVHVGNMGKTGPLSRADAIIVLTGGPQRINTGLDLLAGKQAERLFITGVNAQVSLEKILSLWRGHIDDPGCCIILGHRAHNTAENALEALSWARRENLRSIVLVTSNYHMPRALMEFSHALPGVSIRTWPVISSDTDPKRTAFWRETFREYNKTILAWLRLTLMPQFAGTRMQPENPSS